MPIFLVVLPLKSNLILDFGIGKGFLGHSEKVSASSIGLLKTKNIQVSPWIKSYKFYIPNSINSRVFSQIYFNRLF